MQREGLNQDFSGPSGELHQQVLEFCRHIAGSAQITAISLLDNSSTGTASVKATLETVLVIRDFQPRLMSYVKIVGGRSMLFFAAGRICEGGKRWPSFLIAGLIILASSLLSKMFWAWLGEKGDDGLTHWKRFIDRNR